MTITYAEQPSTLPAAEVSQLLVQYGVKKFKDRYENLFMKAFAGGALLAFGGLLSEILQAGSGGIAATNPGLVKVAGGFVFPVGLTMIILQTQELLTSNMLIMPMAVSAGAIPWWGLPLNWFIVFWGNLVGSIFFAAILTRYSGIVAAEPYATFVRNFAIHKAADPQWHQIFLRGVGCNWLVSAAVWQAAAAKDTISKVFAIWIPVWVFVALGLDHVVANMFSVPLGIMYGADLTVNNYIYKSLFAALIGNAVGALFVALPASYMYRDYGAGGLRAAEAGSTETVNATSENSIRIDNGNKKEGQ